jgi:methyltransferase
VTGRTLAAIIVLAFLTAERLWEAGLGERNRGRMMVLGAVEHSPAHYWLILVFHAAWLATLWWSAPGRRVSAGLLGAAGLLQLARFWIVATLGPRWTTRILVLPQVPLVQSGPYRFLDHPNYALVAIEVPLLPCAFGLWTLATISGTINLVLLLVRVRAEDRALERRVRRGA